MDFLSILKDIAPTAATMLGGPLAGLAVKFLAGKVGATEETADAVTTALSSMGQTAEGRIKLAEIDAALRTHAIDAGIDLVRLSVANAGDVNKTMQTESASDHWPTYSWRPFIGFAVGINTVASAVLVLGVYGGVMAGVKEASAALPTLPLAIGALAAISGTVLPILGIASWFRGKAQADPAVPTDMRG